MCCGMAVPVTVVLLITFGPAYGAAPKGKLDHEQSSVQAAPTTTHSSPDVFNGRITILSGQNGSFDCPSQLNFHVKNVSSTAAVKVGGTFGNRPVNKVNIFCNTTQARRAIHAACENHNSCFVPARNLFPSRQGNAGCAGRSLELVVEYVCDMLFTAEEVQTDERPRVIVQSVLPIELLPK